MFVERIETNGLAQYSYIVGDKANSVAAVVDPRRDVDVYVEYAARHGLRLAHVLETHIHADFASGARELAERAGAELALSAYDDGETYDVAIPHRELRDGDRIELGAVSVTALHTPGHTPEHLSFLVEGADPEPRSVLLSGDFLFVGSLGRPDLLGDDEKVRLAGQMHDSVRGALAALGDGVEIHPGHGAGSMCGAGMGSAANSTLGVERLANPYLDPSLDREAFMSRLLAEVPPLPPYYLRMKRLNAEGPPLLGGLPGSDALDAADVRRLSESERHVVVDCRDYHSFGSGHVPGAFGIGAGPLLAVWASWVVPYETPILLVADDERQREEAARGLVRVGLGDVRGHLAGGMEAWRAAGLPEDVTPQIEPAEAAKRMAAGEIHLVDVRAAAEWDGAHAAGARHVVGTELADRVAEVPDDGRPVAVVCAGGYRSTVGASVLARAGRKDVLNVAGGMRAWMASGLPVER